MNVKSKRFRITLWNVLTLIVVFGLVCFYLLYTIQSSLIHSVDKDLSFYTHVSDEQLMQAPTVSDTLAQHQGAYNSQLLLPGSIYHQGPFLGNLSAERLESYSARVIEPRLFQFPKDFESPNAEEVGVIGPSEAGLAAIRQGSMFNDTAIYLGKPFRVRYRPVLINGKVQRVYQVSYPTSEIESLLQSMRTAMFSSLPVVAALAIVAGWLVTSRSFRQIKNLAHAAATLDADDLSKRLPVQGDDEFAYLARAFNSVLTRLQVAFEDLDYANHRQIQFVADASHELRTPLTIMRANTSWVLQRRRSVNNYIETLKETDNAIVRMSALVEDLLVIAQLDAGKQNPSRTPVVLMSLLEKVAQELAHIHLSPEVIFIGNSHLSVVADQEALSRMFRNILENSYRYTDATGHISCSVAHMGDLAVINVSDSGIGIPAEHLPFVTERFYRVDPSRSSSGGAGLGLAICKEIAESHGGRLWVSSATGLGTTVHVELPVAASPH